jgi:hypothetical protein
MNIMRVFARLAIVVGLCAAAALPAGATRIVASGLTGALIEAGGGPGTFSSVRAFASMVGDSVLQTELGKLRSQYGSDNVDFFVGAFDYAMHDSWQLAGLSNISVPSQQIGGHALAQALVNAGTNEHVFTTRRFLGVLLTPKLRNEVVNDLKLRYGADQTEEFVRIGNQFFYDVAQLVGDQYIALSPNH